MVSSFEKFFGIALRGQKRAANKTQRADKREQRFRSYRQAERSRLRDIRVAAARALYEQEKRAKLLATQPESERE
jgi:hypothetical protein